MRFNGRRLVSLVAAVGVGGGVLSQVYGVAAALMDEVGIRSQWNLGGRVVHAGATLVLGALIGVVLVFAGWSRARGDSEERAFRREMERRKDKARATRP